MSTTINKETHYENHFIRIKYIEEKGFIEEVWKDYGEDDEIKIAKEKLTEMLSYTKSKAYLSDLLGFKGASPEVQLWVRDVWFETAFNAGLTTIAFTVPEDIFADFSVETAIGGEFAGKMKLEKFISYKDAERWLENK